MSLEYCRYCGFSYEKRAEHKCEFLYVCPICGEILNWNPYGVFITISKSGVHCHDICDFNEPYIVFRVASVPKSVAEKLKGGFIGVWDCLNALRLKRLW